MGNFLYIDAWKICLAYANGSFTALNFYKQISNLRVGLSSAPILNVYGTALAGNINVTGSLTASALLSTNLSLMGTNSGTILQLINSVATLGTSVSTVAFGAIGVTPGTAMEQFALTSHRWWTGSS